jgi:hypothetical protein
VEKKGDEGGKRGEAEGRIQTDRGSVCVRVFGGTGPKVRKGQKTRLPQALGKKHGPATTLLVWRLSTGLLDNKHGLRPLVRGDITAARGSKHRDLHDSDVLLAQCEALGLVGLGCTQTP